MWIFKLFCVITWMIEFWILLKDFIPEIVFIHDSILVSYSIKYSSKLFLAGDPKGYRKPQTGQFNSSYYLLCLL